MSNPYLIEGPALISFSGGRTSGYMLWHILEAHGGTLPDDVHVCFANTGKEREETLRFVHECATRWGVRVRWLEWSKRERGTPWEGGFIEVGFNSASRAGEPFEAVIRDRGFLPNAFRRFCSQELKVRTMQNFMRSHGLSHFNNAVGLRADEMHRVERALRRNEGKRDALTAVMPLANAGVTERDVRAWWGQQNFDLQLLPFEGNCDACFLKARPKLWEVERTRPGTLDWWIAQEASVVETAEPSGCRFNLDRTYAELKRDVWNQPDMFAGGLFDDDPAMDTECGLWCEEAA